MKHRTQFGLLSVIAFLLEFGIPIYIWVKVGCWEAISAFFIFRIFIAKLWAWTRNQIYVDYAKVDEECDLLIKEIKTHTENIQTIRNNADASVWTRALWIRQARSEIDMMRYKIMIKLLRGVSL